MCACDDRTWRGVASVVVAVVLFVSPGFAETQASPPEQLRTISGVVVDSDTRARITGASVSAAAARTATDAAGRFELRVPAEVLRIDVVATGMARFPFQKTLDAFDFKFQPSIDPKVIRELATGRYLEGGDNVLLLGPPGVGKTHLAVALGLQACAHGVRVLFTTATGLIATLVKAFAEGRLDERLKLLVQPQLLIIDEIGYIPIDRQGANLFFQLVSRRYERGAIILTSNQSLGAWGDVFGDPVIATAILDRLLHHSVTVNIRGDSYRLREKMKAGLLKSKTTMSAATA